MEVNLYDLRQMGSLSSIVSYGENHFGHRLHLWATL